MFKNNNAHLFLLAVQTDVLIPSQAFSQSVLLEAQTDNASSCYIDDNDDGDADDSKIWGNATLGPAKRICRNKTRIYMKYAYVASIHVNVP